MKILVVDDEPLAQQRLEKILSEFPKITKVLTANNGLEAIKACQEHQPDIILLDIRMPVMDGLDAAQHISKMDKVPAIIFTTAYDEYAVKAFNVHAVDYLLKPVRKEKLQLAINAASQLNQAQLNAIKSPLQGRTNITSKFGGNIKLIPVDDIIYFLAEQKYVTVKHLHGETIIDDTLKDLQVEFEAQFIRIHRNALVAKKFILGISKKNHKRSFVTLKNSSRNLEISRTHLNKVKQFLINL